jgi:hypothetical protein
MVSKELKETLDKYQIGDKLRSLRLRRKMAWWSSASTPGFRPRSKLEHNKLDPTLPTRSRIALVFSIGLEYFFADDKLRRTFARAGKKERLAFPNGSGS